MKKKRGKKKKEESKVSDKYPTSYIILAVFTVLIVSIALFNTKNPSNTDAPGNTLAPPATDDVKPAATEIESDYVCEDCNVVLISIETTRADHLGSYGYERDTSPFIDSLANEGILFERHFTVRGWTWPSLTSMLTSLYPTQHNVRRNGHVLDDKTPVISGILQDEGYTTAAFLTNYAKALNYHFDGRFKGNDIRVTREFSRWAGRNKDEKFFAWIHLFAPHKPYVPPKEFDVFTDKNYDGEYNGSKEVVDRIALDQVDLSPEDLNHIVSLYDAEILYADNLVKGIYNRLESLGIVDKTIVIITSDHGEDLYQHNRYFYHECSIYDSSLHVPLIIWLPGGRYGGKRVENIVENTDITPTILELLDIQSPPSFEGRSLMTYIKANPPVNIINTALAEHDNGPLSIRTGKWRYIYNPDNITTVCHPRGDYYKIDTEELYNIIEDPDEQNNVIDDYPDIASSLREDLLRSYPKGDDNREPIIADEQTLEELRALGYLV